MSERPSGMGQNAWFRKPSAVPASADTDAFLGPADAKDPLLKSTRMSGGSGLEDGATASPERQLGAAEEVTKPSTASRAPTGDDVVLHPGETVSPALPFDRYPDT